jgi:hypothetical protein
MSLFSLSLSLSLLVDGEKLCALSHFPYYLAIENSERSEYATEKLWQVSE